MKQEIQNRFAFIGKSMLWSLLLWVTMMLAINWDEVSSTFRGKTEITIINTTQGGENQTITTRASVSQHTGVVKNVITILKTISGLPHRPADR